MLAPGRSSVTITTHDLRHAWGHLAAVTYAPDDSQHADEGADDGPSPDGLPFASGAGQDEDDPDPTDPSGDDEEGKPDNPSAQKASREAAKWRTKFRKAEERIAELEANAGDGDGGDLADENRLLRIQLEFERQGQQINDRDAAWRLVQDDLAAVEVDDDGTPDADRVGAIVAHVPHRYPHLCDAPADDEGGSANDHTTPPASPSGAAVNGRKKPTDGVTPPQLYRKFPALMRSDRRW